ncbi:putative DNA methyltransferase (plasmid) [Acidiphilium multivorum AIU301]|uniref:Methyltransferase n=1 Tax=Acidiphilium multivorum (strain DSM 11245 / JCM 8867 / NBRC 100883 / AIU 301) TaxID=926570 RepID=F0J853_ACIMA|nr:DNA methyltransferase [Acidiphilium multivorum]BAJ83270.1 putative DNA methyltransferase [Acidiphilium multivorum AIU301]GAN72832.1 DNA methyltransferase [Acidiphilium multivorum AIU301]
MNIQAKQIPLSDFTGDYRTVHIGRSQLVHADAFEWLSQLPPESVDGMVFDPPYGVKEYELDQIEMMLSGGPGIWRLPPSFDGSQRAPLPRFTALNPEERTTLHRFFRDFAVAALPALKPGAHIFMASNSFLSQLVFSAMIDGGFEFRTEIIRLVQTLRGGDRPKLGEEEYPDVCSLPRGGYEPWGLFRKPMPPKMTVRECLRIYGTGGLRRRSDGNPFCDVIDSERTPKREKEIAPHPSLKPQSLLRQLVRAVLPLGKGVVVDPFMGSGSTVAAAEAVGYKCVGVERYDDYFEMATKAVPRLITVKAAAKSSHVVSVEQAAFCV